MMHDGASLTFVDGSAYAARRPWLGAALPGVRRAAREALEEFLRSL